MSSKMEDVRSPTLFVDLSLLYKHDSRTGIQRVVRSIWQNLQTISTCWSVKAVFATSQHGYCHIPGNFIDDRASVLSDPPQAVQPHCGDIFLGLDLAPRLIVQHERQLAEWRRAGVTIAMVIYDLLALTRPQWFTRKTRRNVSHWFKAVARQANVMLCISKTVAAEVAHRIPNVALSQKDAFAIRCIPLGSDIEVASSTALGLDEQAWLMPLQSRPYALMVGTVEPRKGYRQVLAAYERLWTDSDNDRTTLVIVGKPGWRTWLLQYRIRRHRENGRRLFWHSSASDVLLLHLYRECHFVIQASFDEGFGLPLVEALANGRPVLARDIPIFREAGGTHVTFFDKDDPITLSTAILEFTGRARHDPSLLRPSHLMTWRQCAEQLLLTLGIRPPCTGAPTEDTSA